jgi:CRISPR-associated endonuclease Cas1
MTPQSTSPACDSAVSDQPSTDEAVDRRERGREYADANDRWQAILDRFTAADKQKQRTIILSGYGASLSIRRDRLILQDGAIGKKPDAITLHRGVHGVAKIILLDVSGNLTFDALRWCREQRIIVSILDYRADLCAQLVPDGEQSDAVLRRAQYLAHETGRAVQISQEIVRRKLRSQAATLTNFLPTDDHAADVLGSSLAWLEMETPPPWLCQIDKLLSLEGRCANAYFEAWKGFPLKWAKPDTKKISPHWLTFTERASPLAPWENARHAVSPINATLNYAYSLLESQVRLALLKQGFDPACGFLHVDRRGHEALVYDLMECHRAEVDALVLAFLKKTKLRAGDFIKVMDGSCRAHPALARYIVTSCRIRQSAIDKTARDVRDLLMKGGEQ